MGYPKRLDPPGSWHHVGNRGQAHRPIFISPEEMALFFEALVRGIRLTHVEIHAYTVLSTHFHLLVRSPGNALARAMQITKSWFVRQFNRRHDRNGALFDARYWARLLMDLADRILVTRYIDANAVAAGLVARSVDYAWASASCYGRREGPPWLTRTWIEYAVAGRRAYRPEVYDAWSSHNRAAACWLAERRFRLGARPLFGDGRDGELRGPGEDPRRHIQSWFERNQLIADGAPLRCPLATPEAILDRIADACASQPDTLVVPGRRRQDPWTILRVGLLREACGLTLREIAPLLAISASAAERAARSHGEFLHTYPRYAAVARENLAAAVADVEALLLAGTEGVDL